MIEVRAEGFLTLQRTLVAPARDYAWAGELAMTARDSASTRIEIGVSHAQVHRGSIVRDAWGERRATLVFPPRLRADRVVRPGSRGPLDELHVRATEYTVGDRGVEAMPGTLPDATAYTYAVELDADEVADIASAEIEFNADVALYIENFLGFPVGGRVPVGYYDRFESLWKAESDGRIVQIVGHDDSQALIDVDGDGAAERDGEVSAAGIPEHERRALRDLYPVGTQLWRVEMRHFSPWDCNWPFGPPDDAVDPDNPLGLPNVDDPCFRYGSLIECESQVLRESAPITGTGLAVHYSSAHVPGRRAA